ncbi:MAG: DEAH-box ATP-dependent RNA helicase prp22 [Watsoniomyces obsoletus]|nr:MAG: DEAH-box ATP-dependent RNA helicase prp22 [Watsoniomyces obsoletus]
MDVDERPHKRHKIKETQGTDPRKAVASAQQLRRLLRFQQDALLLKEGIYAFKTFLNQLGEDAKDLTSTSQDGLSILEDYFQSQKSQDGAEGDIPFLPDIMQTWSFAFQSDDGALLSAIPKVLVLIFKRISGLIQFREYGLQLCRAILLPAPLKALARGMSAIPNKGDLICSCLQLLIEVVCYDGGTYAKRVYSNRELAFRSLVRNLGLRSSLADQQHAALSVRLVAVRYILANLKYQGAANKSDLLQYRSIISPLLKDIKEDPPGLVLKILDTFKQHVIQDEVLSRKTKSIFFSEWVLGRFATLYSHGNFSASAEDEVTLRSKVHELLFLVCTTPVAGLVPSIPGRYTLVEDPAQNQQMIKAKDVMDIGPQLLSYDDWRGLAPRNFRLEEFTLHLRPHSDTLQCELLLKIFQAVPDLVPEYFFKRQTFTFDPKLSATWVGYCAFLVSVIRLPVPSLGRGDEASFRLPPPVAVLIESILPTPLTQKVLTRCLTQKSSLVAFFTVRLLIAAFRKLQLVLKALRSKVVTNYREAAATELVNEFSRRCPMMKDVITLFRATSEDQVLHREAVTRLLALYYINLPELAAEETVDLAVPLAKLVHRVSFAGDDSSGAALRVLELEHLLIIGKHSSNMRWTNKPDQLEYSPLMMLMKLYIRSSPGTIKNSVEAVLRSFNHSVQMLQESTDPPALDALLASLLSSEMPESSFILLDNAISRLLRREFQYEKMVDGILNKDKKDMTRSSSDFAPFSRLLAALVEQWAFYAQLEEVKDAEKTATARILSKLLRYCMHLGEEPDLLNHFSDLLVNASEGSLKEIFRTSLEPITDDDLQRLAAVSAAANAAQHDEAMATEELSSEPDEDQVSDDDEDYGAPVQLPDPKALFKWDGQDLQEAAENGDVSDLIMCLCSDLLSTRVQALTALGKVVQKLQHSSYVEQEMIVLLLQEIIHNAKPIIRTRPLPTYVGAFAAKAILIETDPQHFLYGTLNRFLHRGPVWNMEKVPMIQAVFLHPPEIDNTFHASTAWMLEVIYDGLRTPEDVNVYRHSGVFERCFTLYTASILPSKSQQLILKIVGRAIGIPGGSTTLITRVGIIGWFEGLLADRDPNSRVIQRLRQRLLSTCDQERIRAWSGGDLCNDIGSNSPMES